jgi:dimethylamine/trimethylamine dehydrogenase
MTGVDVTYITPAPRVSNWSINTTEQFRIHQRLAELGVHIILNHGVEGFDGNQAIISCVYTEKEQAIVADNLVLVTCRQPEDNLFNEVQSAIEQKLKGAPLTVKRIGDADAPAIIAAAVYSGHKYARELDVEVDRDNPIKYDRVFFNDE